MCDGEAASGIQPNGDKGFTRIGLNPTSKKWGGNCRAKIAVKHSLPCCCPIYGCPKKHLRERSGYPAISKHLLSLLENCGLSPIIVISGNRGLSPIDSDGGSLRKFRWVRFIERRWVRMI